MTSTTESRPTGIPVRRPKVDLANADVDRWLVPGDPLFSHFLAALSAVFPNGEDFFVDSVRNYRDLVAPDHDLRVRVKGFIGQEAMHGREHRAFNRRLDVLGYPTVALDAALAVAASRLKRYSEPLQLSVTAASEHFTSVLAHALLNDDETRATLFPKADGQLLITWHALEELEHKDVAFDVFELASGSYRIRLAGLALAAHYFGRVVLGGYARAVVADRKHVTSAARRRYRRNLRHQKMVSFRVAAELARYLRPGFHPRDIDTDALVVEWRERLGPQMTTASGHREAVAVTS